MTERTGAGRLDRRGMRERAERATPGPWEQAADTPWGSKVILNESGEFYVGVSAHTTPPGDGWSPEARDRAYELGRKKCADANFIAHARADIPALLDLTDTLVERLRGAVERCCPRVVGEPPVAESPCDDCAADLALLASLGEGEE